MEQRRVDAEFRSFEGGFSEHISNSGYGRPVVARLSGESTGPSRRFVWDGRGDWPMYQGLLSRIDANADAGELRRFIPYDCLLSGDI